MKEFISEDDARRFEQLARIERGRQVLTAVACQTRENRRDGYVNMLNKYGTSQDNSTAYSYSNEPMTPDLHLTQQYETGGLFSKIIDLPAEEAVKHGFDMNLNNPDIEEYIDDSLDWLEWEEKAATAIKWARLFGGSIIVMLVNDGRGIEEPMDWQNIKGIDELRVYERAVVQPDYTSIYSYDPRDPLRKTTSHFAMPEFYNVFSMYGTFKVHESRCLVFRNGVLPERTTQAYYRHWGMPEYSRIQKELREAITSHSYGVKMLERSVQAIYSMKDLAQLLSTDEGEDIVLKRLQVIDMARGILNSIAIDSEGEQYDFKNMQLSGVKDVIDTTCNMLSAVTNIPQTLLFGRSPAGENSTGESDLENYYNHVERIQKLMLRGNLKTLLDVIIRAGLTNGRIEEEPAYKLKFVPLWSMSEAEQASVEQTKATTAQTKAQTAQIYVDMGAVDPSEIRAGLAKDEEFNIEELLDDASDDELWGMSDQTTVSQPEESPETQQGDTGDTEWITVNGTPVPLDREGNLSGHIGEKIKQETLPENGIGHITKEQFRKSVIGDKEKIIEEIRDFAGFGYSEIRKSEERSSFINATIEQNPHLKWNGGTLYRGVGMTDEELASLKVGSKVKPGASKGFYENAPSSWSANEATAISYSRSPEDEKGNRVVFTERSTNVKNAMSREGVTGKTPESEAIYSGETDFTVNAITPNYEFVYPNGVRRKVTLVDVSEAVTKHDSKAQETAVLVMRDGKVLIGKRIDGNGWCGPGGRVEDGESTEEAATRELTEEFGIVARELIPIGTVTGLDEQFGEPVIFLCTDYDGEPACDGKEMEDAQFVEVNDLDDLHLFPPFIASVNMLLDEVAKVYEPPLTARVLSGRMNEESLTDGGPGSGRYPKGSGGSMSEADKERYRKRMVGQTTADGVKITSVSEHAFERLGGRLISPGRIDKMIATQDIKPGNTDRTRCYDIQGSRMVLDTKKGKVVSVMWRKGNK